MQTSSTQGTQTQPRLWTFIFIRVGMITAITGICTQMFMSAFPQYLQQRGFTATQMGLVASGYTICAMVMRIFAGNLIDTKGRRVMCLLGLAMFGFPIFGFYMGPAIAFIVVMRFFQGFGSSLATIATGTMAPMYFRKSVWPRVSATTDYLIQWPRLSALPSESAFF